MAFWMPEMEVNTTATPVTMATMSQRPGSLGIPRILETPPEMFRKPWATEPAMPAPMEKRVMASIIFMVRGRVEYLPSTGAISLAMEKGRLAL